MQRQRVYGQVLDSLNPNSRRAIPTSLPGADCTLPPCPHLLGAYLFGGLRMDRFVIMVDAGYLLHKGVEIVGKRPSTERRELELTDPFALIRLLIDQSRTALALGMHAR